jgi:hypothetical protein
MGQQVIQLLDCWMVMTIIIIIIIIIAVMVVVPTEFAW